nr:hypothetical protein [Tanacetum cinerariifolium]
MESIFTTALSSVAPLPSPTSTMTPSIITTTTTASQPPIPPTPIPSEVLQNLPTFESVFRFEDRVKSLEVNFSKFMRTNQFAEAVSNIPEEPVQTTCQIDEPLHPVFETGVEDQPIVQTSQHPEWFSQPRKPPTPDGDWNKTLPAVQGSAQSWISELAKQVDARSSFNELLDTSLNFSNFIMNRLDVDTLTPELLAGPTYELIKGLCNSLTELEYHLEEPLPLIPDNRGRRVISFAHFINNDLEYLRGGASSKKYTTSVTKTKAAYYGHIKWIEDLFYGFAVNRESALDVYSKRRIIAVTDLKIVEWEANVSLRIFTRSIIIQWRVEDLQLGVESYQKRLNLTKPDMYRSDLKQREADGTLNDVCNALDDRLKGIRMQYLPTTIWRKGDKDRAAAMIQAIDKMLKTMRIMRSFERFVGGRQYEGDFRMLQRTI